MKEEAVSHAPIKSPRLDHVGLLQVGLHRTSAALPRFGNNDRSLTKPCVIDPVTQECHRGAIRLQALLHGPQHP